LNSGLPDFGKGYRTFGMGLPEVFCVCREVRQMNISFGELMQFRIFILALLTFVYTITKK